MKIRISDLPPEGLNISDTIPVEDLNRRLNEGRPSEIRFTAAPRVDVFICPYPEGAEVRGKASTKYLQACGRCTDEVERDLEVEFSYILKPKPAQIDPKTALEYEDDRGIIFFDGEHVELEGTVQEALILSLSIYWSPPADDSGVCTLCGKNPVSELVEKPAGIINIGELLKKAGVN